MTARFTYPDFGRPDGFPEHTAHSGQECTITRELGDDERDPEVGRMFMVRFADGAELCVNADELSEVPARRLVRCPVHPVPVLDGGRHTPGTIAGCNHLFTAEPDGEGLFDCPKCGMWFNPDHAENQPQPTTGARHFVITIDSDFDDAEMSVRSAGEKIATELGWGDDSSTSIEVVERNSGLPDKYIAGWEMEPGGQSELELAYASDGELVYVDDLHGSPASAPQVRAHLKQHGRATQDLDDTVLEDVHNEAHGNAGVAGPGYVMVNLRIDVSDAAALVEAGRRSVARDLSTWVPGKASPVTDECREVITDPAQAVVDLLVEAWVRCYGGYLKHPAFVEVLADAEWGDVDNKEWYPNGQEV